MQSDVVVYNPDHLIEIALQKGADLANLEKLLNIQREYNRDMAKSDYHKSMAAFKANPPQIDKDKSVSFGQGKAAYKHASLYNVVEKLTAALSKHDLSASWVTNQSSGISVTCRITHIKGHSEETTLTAPADVSGSKNAIQAIGSTITYLQRYTLLSLCGLATYDSDDDGVAAATEFISKDELGQLLDLVADKEADLAKFCDYLKVESLEKLPKSEFKKAVTALQNKKKGGK